MLAARIDALAGDDGVVVAFSAEEVYVFGERRSPHPFLRLSEPFVPFLPLVGMDGCREVLERTLALDPTVVVVGLIGRTGPCQWSIKPLLLENGYYDAGHRDWLFVYARRVAPEPRRDE